jgi:hypothetical protein
VLFNSASAAAPPQAPS